MGVQDTENKELMQCDPMYKNQSLQNPVLETPLVRNNNPYRQHHCSDRHASGC
jgi:hypothetical protein